MAHGAEAVEDCAVWASVADVEAACEGVAVEEAACGRVGACHAVGDKGEVRGEPLQQEGKDGTGDKKESLMTYAQGCVWPDMAFCLCKGVWCVSEHCS